MSAAMIPMRRWMIPRCAFVERAQRPFHVDLVGDDVRRPAGLHAADRQHALLAVERDEARQQFGARRHGVFELLAHGAVAARAVDAEAQFVACGHVFPGPEPEGPDLQLRFNVLAHHGPHVVSVERLFGQHQRRLRPGCTPRQAGTARRAYPEVGLAANSFRTPNSTAVCDVVAAGVHHALVLRPPCAVVPLGDGQGVGVGAQDDGTPVACGRLAALDAGQYAGGCDPAVLDAQLRELLLDERRRAVLPERELGMRMQVTPKFDRIIFLIDDVTMNN